MACYFIPCAKLLGTSLASLGGQAAVEGMVEECLEESFEGGIGGFLPKDLEKQFPAGFAGVSLPGLHDFADEYVIAWSATEAARRPEIARLAKKLGGS